MKHKLIFLFFFLIATACGGSGSGSDSDDRSITRAPSVSGAEPPVLTGNTGLDPDMPFNFGGHYTGSCVVKALGVSSQTCSAALNIYHNLKGLTIGFMGTVDVDMGITALIYPVAAAPQDIMNGKIYDPDSREEIGIINYKGFIIEQSADFMVFNRRVDGGFDFIGEYQDPNYGLINIEGAIYPNE